MECKKRQHQVSFSNTPTTHPLTKENVGSAREELAPEDLDLGEPQGIMRVGDVEG